MRAKSQELIQLQNEIGSNHCSVGIKLKSSGKFTGKDDLQIFKHAFFQALRCQTDDGVTDEEVAKTLRVCVRKQLNEGNEYEEYEDYIWENADPKTNSRPTRLNKRNVYRNIYNEYLVEKRNTYRASYKEFPNESKGNNKTSDGRNNNSTQRCLMQCFFEELKMVINFFHSIIEFPDKLIYRSILMDFLKNINRFTFSPRT